MKNRLWAIDIEYDFSHTALRIAVYRSRWGKQARYYRYTLRRMMSLQALTVKNYWGVSRSEFITRYTA